MNEKYFQITNAVYKAIEFFPEDPLKGKTKEKALEIMEGLVWVFGNPGPIASQKAQLTYQVLENIEVLKTYLRLAKSQGWLDKLNFLILAKEYDRIKDDLQPASPPKFSEGKFRRASRIMQRAANDPSSFAKEERVETPDKPIKVFSDQISERQQKIIEVLKQQEKAQVADFKRVFPDISKRTLRRDLDDLLKRGMIVRTGEWNQIVYKIMGTQIRQI